MDTARDGTDALPTVVVLAGPGRATNAVVHRLEADLGAGCRLLTVLEEPQSRIALARRRAQRLGWRTVAGQVLFSVVVFPALAVRGRRRISCILDAGGLETGPIAGALRVASVNDPGTIGLLTQFSPSVVVVQGTRIIADRVLREVAAPFINLHAGITPRYRGVHGGYWALAEGRPDLVGSTIHLVDAGVDTGAILSQVTFAPGSDDTIATYPYLHVTTGIPALVEEVRLLLDGRPPRPVPPLPGAEVSVLRWHPTAWAYLRGRVFSGVR